jgi:hypothetical protein
VAAEDAEGQAADGERDLVFDVLTERGVRPLFIRTRAVPTLIVGEAVDLALACEGGAPPYRWVAETPLPEGLMLEGIRISGVPEEAVTVDVRLSVTGSAGEQATTVLRIETERLTPLWLTLLLGALLLASAALLLRQLLLSLRRAPLSILTESIPNARASAEYSVQLAGQGGVPPYRWRLVEGELPPGLELTPEGRIHGVPFRGLAVDETKEVVFTVEIKDARGHRAVRKL